jgi:hypothetical protein
MGRLINGITLKTTKKYPRITAGPLRNQYLHRVVAAAFIGRKLKKDEEVHHKDGDKLNFWFTNLMVLGSADHSWVSSRQAWYMREKDQQAKQEWDKFMAEEADRFDIEVLQSKAEGLPWAGHDGLMSQRFANQHMIGAYGPQ